MTLAGTQNMANVLCPEIFFLHLVEVNLGPFTCFIVIQVQRELTATA